MSESHLSSQLPCGAAYQAADPLSSGSCRLKAGCGQDWPPHKGFRWLLMLFMVAVLFAQPAQPPSEQKEATHQYSLPPDKLQKAIDYSTARNWLHFISPLYGIAVLLAT